MPSAARKPKADSQIQMRIQPQVRDLIDRAAVVTGKSRTEFILESARAEAINILVDQRVFLLDGDQARAVEAALTNPPKPNAALKNLMRSRPPWE